MILSFLLSLILLAAQPADFLGTIAGHKTAVLTGSLADIELSGTDGNLRLERYNTQSDMLRALQMGKVEYAISDSTFLLSSPKERRWYDVVSSGFQPADIAAAFGYQNSRLCEDFNVFLDSLKADGRFNEIVQRWSGFEIDEVPMPEGVKSPKGVLNVGVLGGNIPFAFVSEEHFAGIEPELVTLFANSLGWSVAFHEYELGALPAALETGRIDIAIAAMCVTPERQKAVLFSNPYFHTCNVCLKRSSGYVYRHGNFVERLRRSLFDEERYVLILEGLVNTLIMSVLSILFGTLFGAIIGLECFGKYGKWWRRFLHVYGKLMHGIPLLVLLLIMFYIVFANTGLSTIAIATITFTVYLIYACAEIFVNGIEGVPAGQMKAASSLGLTRRQAFRYVILPQTIRSIIPPYSAEIITIIKETSIAGFIAVVDLTKATDIIQSRTFDAFIPLLTTAVIYYVICNLVGTGLHKLSAKFSRK